MILLCLHVTQSLPLTNSKKLTALGGEVGKMVGGH